MARIPVFLAEDNPYLRDALIAFFGAQDDIACVGSTSQVELIAAEAGAVNAEVVVLDIELNGKSSLRMLPELRKGLPGTQFIIFSGHAEPTMIRAALAAGAASYVSKANDIEDLAYAIRRAAGPDATVPAAVSGR